LDTWERLADRELIYLVVSELFAHVFLQHGEIDIIEGVHDNEHNQVTWHTSAGHP
jgi:hypothetical protein